MTESRFKPLETILIDCVKSSMQTSLLRCLFYTRLFWENVFHQQKNHDFWFLCSFMVLHWTLSLRRYKRIYMIWYICRSSYGPDGFLRASELPADVALLQPRQWQLHQPLRDLSRFGSKRNDGFDPLRNTNTQTNIRHLCGYNLLKSSQFYLYRPKITNHNVKKCKNPVNPKTQSSLICSRACSCFIQSDIWDYINAKSLFFCCFALFHYFV